MSFKLSAFILALTLSTSAYAASVHLKPNHSNPTFTDNGLTLSASGALAGLGNGDIVINMAAKANATAVCINPGSGDHQPPGQNPAPVTVNGSTSIPQDQIKNGNVAFVVTTVAPASPIPTDSPDFTCPNPNWTEVITDLSFTSALIEVNQDLVNVLNVSCTFTPATVNGPVPKQEVKCTVN